MFQYLLVAVNSFTGWPEALPAKQEDNASIIKCLIKYYIQQHRFPERIRLDNGFHFKSADSGTGEKAQSLKRKHGRRKN